MSSWEGRYAQVIVEGGHREFFNRFLLAENVASLVVVSPWISSVGEMADQFRETVRKIGRERINTTVVVRPPSREPTNRLSVQVLDGLPTVSMYFNPELHAKIYVCRCAPYGFAYVGSANLTGRGTVAYEVGLIIEGKGHGQKIVDELRNVGTIDLLNRAGTREASTKELFGGT